jgi:hypothetical protein
LPSQPNIQIAADIVKSAFPAKGFADLAEVAGFLGIAKKTAQNWVSAGRFPVQTVLINGRRLVQTPAIIHYLASTSGLPPQQEAIDPIEVPEVFPVVTPLVTAKRSTGRPTNREKGKRRLN